MTKHTRQTECWAERYRLREEVLEVMRQTPGIITQAEALVIARANLARRQL